ncbi:MAG TPA: S8 family serine peptidase, partial [Anaerolineales bacterium]|nr:S8 family serine peptidase [Anaerolineales bacterium]
MSKISRFLTFLLVLAIATGSLAGALSYQRAAAAAWREKVDPWVLQTATDQSQTEFLVFLTEQADLSATETMKTKLEKGTYVYETLSTLAERTQKPVIDQLEALNVEYKPYWVANMIWVRGDMSVVQAMAQRTDVDHLYANPTIHIEDLPQNEASVPDDPSTIEWNILMVNADDVWAAGVSGQGVVIGGQDTGYDWDHPALKNHYRGWNGSTADHNYNWFDAIGGNGPCPDPTVPCDDYGHGTHTMGTMVGDDGGSNQIGMAPGAKWIGCRNMDNGNGTPATYSACYQFFIAPTDVNGNNPDPAMAPDVINNSWGCPASEGCNANSLLTIVQAVRAAGIVTVHSAGNDGSSCSTVNTPSAIYEESFSVGSTTSSNTMSGFSSRGPVTVDGSNRLKPNVSAPGSSVRSSIPGTGYTTMSGTSMAGPHVAGLVALLISGTPSLAGQVDTLEDIIEQTAVTVTVNPPQVCGGISSNTIPNNTYGWGRIDALAAYQLSLNYAAEVIDISKTASADYVAPGDILTYTLNITHSTGLTITHNVLITDVLPANTTFITSTFPHSLNGSTVSWSVPDLNVGETYSVDLVVSVNGDAAGEISNADYAVSSDETETAFGTPVNTPVVVYDLNVSKSASASYVMNG